MNDDPVILDDAETADLRAGSVAGGEFVGYTCRSPDKTTPNEDTAAIISYGPQAAVLVVADGVGGMPSGRRASQTAVAALIDSLQAAGEQTMLLRNAILNGIEAANSSVIGIGNGAATTFTVVTIEGRLARAYQVGDSEAIIVGQRGRVRLQTTAHSPTGFAVHAGFLDQREALHHAERHLVSNILGTPDMRIDVGAEIALQARDTILLASDGLMDNVHLHEIIERVRKGPLGDAVGKVTALAHYRMRDATTAQPSKPDDLSLILFRKPPLARRENAAKPET